MFTKRGEAKILEIIDDEDLDDEKTKKALKTAKQTIKNISKGEKETGNKNELLNESGA